MQFDQGVFNEVGRFSDIDRFVVLVDGKEFEGLDDALFFGMDPEQKGFQVPAHLFGFGSVGKNLDDPAGDSVVRVAIQPEVLRAPLVFQQDFRRAGRQAPEVGRAFGMFFDDYDGLTGLHPVFSNLMQGIAGRRAV